MASVASQLIEEVTAHVQRDSLEDAREICADVTYFLNNLRNFTKWQNCILRHLQTSCFQALMQSRVSENSTVALFTIGSYVHSYKFKICAHNNLQNNGIVLFVVKILAAGVRRAKF